MNEFLAASNTPPAFVQPLLEVGDVLEGFCDGYFGRDSYEAKDVLAVGEDWVLVRERDSQGTVQVAQHPDIRALLTKHRVESFDHHIGL